MEINDQIQENNQVDSFRAKYDSNFAWSDVDDYDEDKAILLNDFKKDLADLETGMVAHQNKNQPVPRLSKDDRALSKKQPEIHQKNKGFIESAFGSCCAVNNDLNKRENKYYTKFKTSMIESYDSNNAQHEYNLQQLYHKVFRE